MEYQIIILCRVIKPHRFVDKIRKIAQSTENKFQEILIIDSHNSIIDDEHLIIKDTIEGKELINVSNKFIASKKKEKDQKIQILYGVAKDPLKEFNEKVNSLFDKILNNSNESNN